MLSVILSVKQFFFTVAKNIVYSTNIKKLKNHYVQVSYVNTLFILNETFPLHGIIIIKNNHRKTWQTFCKMISMSKNRKFFCSFPIVSIKNCISVSYLFSRSPTTGMKNNKIKLLNIHNINRTFFIRTILSVTFANSSELILFVLCFKWKSIEQKNFFIFFS